MLLVVDNRKLGTMNKILTAAASSDASTLYKATLEGYLTNIDHLREQMRRDQEETDRSRARTQVILDDLARLLNPTILKAV